MSRKNGTNRAGAAAGLNPFGWGNGKNRKRPKGAGTPMGQANININYTPYYTGKTGGLQDE